MRVFHIQTTAVAEAGVLPAQMPDKGFVWIACGRREFELEQAHIQAALQTLGGVALVVCNFTPVVQPAWRIGVPLPGVYLERINTDSAHYGGSNVGTPLGAVTAEAEPWMGRPYSLRLPLPPLATVIFSLQT